MKVPKNSAPKACHSDALFIIPLNPGLGKNSPNIDAVITRVCISSDYVVCYFVFGNKSSVNQVQGLLPRRKLLEN